MRGQVVHYEVEPLAQGSALMSQLGYPGIARFRKNQITSVDWNVSFSKCATEASSIVD